MPALANQRIAYLNGDYLAESRVLLPFRDRGFLYGDAVFDTTRTFGHRIFRLQAHVDRLYRSLRYLRIDPGLAPEQMIADHRGGARAQPAPAGPRGRLLGLAAGKPRCGVGRRRGAGAGGRHRAGRVHAAALARAGGPLP